MRGARWLKRLAGALVIVVGGLWLANQSSIGFEGGGRPALLAHRGVHQTFPLEGVGNDTCTATRIHPPTHAFIENTLPSIREAFALGAERVEIDIHPTRDGEFVVFHDWTLDCRTDGHGVTREKTLAELKALDVGYGYTADGGATYPLRGTGVGAMPSLREVLGAFPQQRFLVHVKSRDADEGRALADYLGTIDGPNLQRLIVYGSDEPLATLHASRPAVRVTSRGDLKTCLIRYFAVGWTGVVPEACRKGMMLVPVNVAPYLWGWPHRLVDRLAASDTPLYLVGPYTGGDFSRGIDTAEDLAQLPSDYDGGLWTNRIKVIVPMLDPQGHR